MRPMRPVNKRRQMLGLALAGALPAFGQKAPVVVGWMHMGSRERDGENLNAFKKGLAALGWKEKTQYVVSDHWAEGRFARLPGLAAELAKAKPAVVIAYPTQPVAASLRQMPAVPVVQVSAADPVTTGFAKSMARPGGMVTGIANAIVDTTEKFLELLVTAAPATRRVGFLADSTNFSRAKLMEQARRSVAKLGIEARFAEAGTPEEVEAALSGLAAERIDGLVVMPSSLFLHERGRIGRMAQEQRWPGIGARREFLDDGLLLSYGNDAAAQFARAASYADRILKGAKPGDLPVEQATALELSVSLRAAKALHLTIPGELLARAHRVVH